MEDNKDKEVYTVSDINKLVKESLKRSIGGRISVIGEVSNFKVSKTHLYMNLKDKDAIMNVICWNFTGKFPDKSFKNGDRLIISGYINSSVKYGNYQLTAYEFNIDGTGDLHNEYLRIKGVCEENGYFDEKNKRPLPNKINNIGVITALGGAALKDFLYVLNNGNFKGVVYIKGCNVQGRDCPDSVIKSLKELDEMGLDVIVITRGGGSYEDLFGFSDFGVIKEIYNTKTCTLSAIGHEVDFMLSDFVSDIRAPTPSIAGEVIASHQNSLYDLDRHFNFLNEKRFQIRNELQQNMIKLTSIEKSLKPLQQIILDYESEFKDILSNSRELIKQNIQSAKDKILSLNYQLEQNNPKAVFERGYSLVSLLDDKEEWSISSTVDFSSYYRSDKKLKIIFQDGEVLLDVQKVNIFDE